MPAQLQSNNHITLPVKLSCCAPLKFDFLSWGDSIENCAHPQKIFHSRLLIKTATSMSTGGFIESVTVQQSLQENCARGEKFRNSVSRLNEAQQQYDKEKEKFPSSGKLMSADILCKVVNCKIGRRKRRNEVNMSCRRCPQVPHICEKHISTLISLIFKSFPFPQSSMLSTRNEKWECTLSQWMNQGQIFILQFS
ncbi:CLUMA_CG019814, isoform A [Clunio marinus]|uniref:CLUMA_CG019814, isoform A n=1 Tax=Clunio marinus TaxID=568069 RepID=A0A1J1J3F1_9DIPT|nr:CLUMA_CG019814, isoform A [Clunio marinus]